MRYYASLKAITVSSSNCFWVLGASPHFGKSGCKSRERVFSAIQDAWLSGLCHCDQNPLGTQLDVETQPL